MFSIHWTKCERPVVLWLAMLIAVAAASTANAVTFTVNVTGDTPDANPGDGVAEDENGDTSLRAAMEEANALSGADVVQFDSGLANSTIYISDDSLSITDDLTIAGLGQNLLTIDGIYLMVVDSLISITTGVAAEIADLAFDNTPGLAIHNRGTLTVADCLIVGRRHMQCWWGFRSEWNNVLQVLCNRGRGSLYLGRHGNDFRLHI
jgi:hypothetical protein